MTADDGYGDPEDVEALIARFDRWQHYVANSLDGSSSARHDDLVQEGRIALWKAFSRSGERNAAYLTRASRNAMSSAVARDYWTGTEGVQGHARRQPPTDPLDELREHPADAFCEIELAYHEGEIVAAINRLPPAQRRYVIARFWLGMDQRSGHADALRQITGRHKPHSLWSGPGGARERLARDLGHLRDAL